MAGVSEQDIQNRRTAMAEGAKLSTEAIERHEAALAHLKKSYSHDYASQLLHKKGADTVLAEASEEAATPEAPDESETLGAA